MMDTQKAHQQEATQQEATQIDPQAPDWSRTPAAMVASVILGLAAISGLIWSIAHESRSDQRINTQSITTGDQTPSAPARLLIDLNTASVHELQMLPSIGPKIAQRIIDDRSGHGSYESLKDLDRVSGIGPKTLAKLTDWVTISTP